jgi:PadR family transcriptional regulator, regulatory protein AphA
MSTPALSTTSYAILGLLSLRPWSTYELAEQMDRALGAFWPRARSKLYEEPKKLVAHGLATATAASTGNRRRTVYAITPAGRRALRGWMAKPGAGPVLEFEQLVHVFFAEAGTRSQLLDTLAAAQRWSLQQTAKTGHIPGEYLTGRGAFPERLPWLIVVGAFLDEFAAMVERWAAWAIDVVEAWPEDLSQAEPALDALERMASRAQEVSRQAPLE